MAITKTQKELLKKAVDYSQKNPVLVWDNFKNFCEMKSFDMTFNALLFKDYFVYVGTKINSFSLNLKKVQKLNL